MSNNYQVSYIEGKQGSLAVAKWTPVCCNNKLVICIQPFGEELNRTRRVFSQLSRELCKQGFTVWMPDFYGTGDSEGDFSEIDFQHWVSDLTGLVKASSFSKVSFVACRFGVQLLASFLKTPHHIEFERIVLWQPQWDVSLFWKQQWRLLTVSSITKQTGQTQAVLQEFKQRGFIDIQGYQIPYPFYLQTIALVDPTLAFCSCSILWLECQMSHDLSPSTLSWLKQLEQTSPRGIQVMPLAVEPFWLTQEYVDVSLLITTTLTFFGDTSHE